MRWLATAQDRSSSADGGVSRDYSLIHGWASSYPETTGYIIPTMLDYAKLSGEVEWRDRALRMADWLVSIQLPGGGFQGGKIDSTPVVPVTFNTGQILIGLAAAERAHGGYRQAMVRAADWLVQTQESDGRWLRHESPFAATGDKQYETHVAWGLFEAASLERGRGYLEAGLRNVQWAISDHPPNGWFSQCSLGDADRPLTHTIGYALRGVLEAHAASPSSHTLDAAHRSGQGLLGALAPDGFLPGVLDTAWKPMATWSCLTGSAQVALCWMQLEQLTGDARYGNAAKSINGHVRRTVRLAGSDDFVGGVFGSFPLDGDYCPFALPNWAAKFLADSIMQELKAGVTPKDATLHHDNAQSQDPRKASSAVRLPTLRELK